MEQNETVLPEDGLSSCRDDLTVRRRRLLFRSGHRGTFETDLLIGGFAERHVPLMDGAALAEMEAVLEYPDPVLADWLTGRVPVPAACETPVLRAMVAYATGLRGAGPERAGRTDDSF